MARQLDPSLKTVIEKYGLKVSEAVWDCHGTWVMYHWAVEHAAAKAGITFGPPTIIEAKSEAKIVSILVPATLGSKSDWSIGEAAPGNNKNSYPYAMAEKRARDRVALKLLDLIGVYSEEEADDFKTRAVGMADPTQIKSPPGRSGAVTKVRELCREVMACSDPDQLMALLNQPENKKLAVSTCRDYPRDWMGEAENSGLAGVVMSVAQQMKCTEAETWVHKAEQVVRDSQPKQAAE